MTEYVEERGTHGDDAPIEGVEKLIRELTGIHPHDLPTGVRFSSEINSLCDDVYLRLVQLRSAILAELSSTREEEIARKELCCTLRESCDELDTRKAQLESRAIQLSKDKSSRVKELDARLDASTRWFHHLQEDEIKRASRMQQESDCRRIKLESDHYVLVGSDRDSPVMVGTVMVWRHAPEDIPP